jgi:hypothetical protein
MISNAPRAMVAAATGLATLAAWPALATGDPPDAPLRDCASRGESNRPLSGRVGPNDIRFGPLILQRYPEWKKPLRASDAPADWPYIVKAPVKLRAETAVTLTVAPEATGVAAFAHGRDWVAAVRFEACFANQPAFAYRGTVGAITGFPLAVALKKRSACVPIEAWVDGRANPLRRLVPLGRRRC